MQVDDVIARARARSQTLSAPDDGDTLRRDALGFFASIPEPPVYRRRDDPAQARATELLDDGEKLLARALRQNVEGPLLDALATHALALALIVENQIEAAEPTWLRALEHERVATAGHRLWKRSDDGVVPVYDPSTGSSRFDPQPEAFVHATLACPHCRKVMELDFSPRVAQHRFVCKHCRMPFSAYFATVRALEVHPLPGKRRRYVFRVEELAGAQTRIELEDSAPNVMSASHQELLAFLYAPEGKLRGVLNLDTSRVLWLPSPGPCFVATVAFGEGAWQLDVLRAFRDQRLLPNAPGRQVVALYYRHGPALASWVGGRPVVRAGTRQALDLVARALRPGVMKDLE
jgi:hypothetical protein